MYLGEEERALFIACTNLGIGEGEKKKVFTPKQWQEIRIRMANHQLGTAALLYASQAELSLWLPLTMVEQMLILRQNRKLEDALESLSYVHGISLLSTQTMVAGSREVFTRQAPFIYAQGNLDLLNRTGRRLAIVGGRDADEPALRFARRLGRDCAQNDVMVVSGGANGVDWAAQCAALQADGCSIFVLPFGLATRSAKMLSEGLTGRYVMISTYDVNASFSTTRALTRNRLIYALSHAGVVVSCKEGTGGSWAGALNALRSKETPVFTRTDTSQGGNWALMEIGAHPLNEPMVSHVLPWMNEP